MLSVSHTRDRWSLWTNQISAELFLSLIPQIICHHTNPTLPVRLTPGTNWGCLCLRTRGDKETSPVCRQQVQVVLLMDTVVTAQSWCLCVCSMFFTGITDYLPAGITHTHTHIHVDLRSLTSVVTLLKWNLCVCVCVSDRRLNELLDSVDASQRHGQRPRVEQLRVLVCPSVVYSEDTERNIWSSC